MHGRDRRAREVDTVKAGSPSASADSMGDFSYAT